MNLTPPPLNFTHDVYGLKQQSMWDNARTPGNYNILKFTPIDTHETFERLTVTYQLTVQRSSSDYYRYVGWNDRMFLYVIDSGVFVITVHDELLYSLKSFMDGISLVTKTPIKWWVLSANGSLEFSTFYLGEQHAKNEFYPWLDISVDQFGKNYLESTANVLLLMGSPGTGKTSFIRSILHSMNCETWLTYEEKIQTDDRFYTEFMKPDEKPRIMVIEDADIILSSRADGNKLMNRILSFSDGIIESGKRKLIFSTNLPRIAQVDDALLRPGRCFGVLNFRSLKEDEARRACESVNRPFIARMEPGETITLSEALNGKSKIPTIQQLGFTGQV